VGLRRVWLTPTFASRDATPIMAAPRRVHAAVPEDVRDNNVVSTGVKHVRAGRPTQVVRSEVRDARTHRDATERVVDCLGRRVAD
jgi:hypothetical protein